jgi:hypothetical protein
MVMTMGMIMTVTVTVPVPFAMPVPVSMSEMFLESIMVISKKICNEENSLLGLQEIH